MYILDSGVDISHPEFGGRARVGFNAIGYESDHDLNGHGTHVAGVVGGRKLGVATDCNMISVKVEYNLKLFLIACGEIDYNSSHEKQTL